MKRSVTGRDAVAVRLDDAMQEVVVDVEGLAVGEEHARVPLAAASYSAAEIRGMRRVELDGDLGAGRDVAARVRRAGRCEEGRVRLWRGWARWCDWRLAEVGQAEARERRRSGLRRRSVRRRSERGLPLRVGGVFVVGRRSIVGGVVRELRLLQAGDLGVVVARREVLGEN